MQKLVKVVGYLVVGVVILAAAGIIYLKYFFGPIGH